MSAIDLPTILYITCSSLPATKQHKTETATINYVCYKQISTVFCTPCCLAHYLWIELFLVDWRWWNEAFKIDQGALIWNSLTGTKIKDKHWNARTDDRMDWKRLQILTKRKLTAYDMQHYVHCRSNFAGRKCWESLSFGVFRTRETFLQVFSH